MYVIVTKTHRSIIKLHFIHEITIIIGTKYWLLDNYINIA
jgi:hypothetical protein